MKLENEIQCQYAKVYAIRTGKRGEIEGSVQKKKPDDDVDVPNIQITAGNRDLYSHFLS